MTNTTSLLRRLALSALAGTIGLSAPALAQEGDGAVPGEPAPAVGDFFVPSWASPAHEKIASLLLGHWKTTAPVSQWGAADQSVEVTLTVSPITIEGVPSAMYAEMARADAFHAPYRQAIFQLYDFKGSTRLRTYEFRRGATNLAIAGAWAAPEVFPKIARDDLIATLDVELAASGAGYAGRTPYAYPTGIGGAVEMTSEIEIQPDRLVTIDRGIGPDGSIAWGSGEGGKYEFTRWDPGVSVERNADGFVVLHYRKPEGSVAEAGGFAVVQYTGWTMDGNEFDSSRRMGREAFRVSIPPRLIEGWNRSIPDITTGALRRLFIPPQLGYGERGAAGGRIPPNAWLVFEIECVAIEAPPAPVAPAEGAANAPSSEFKSAKEQNQDEGGGQSGGEGGGGE